MLKKEMPEWYAKIQTEIGDTYFCDIYDMEDVRNTAEYFKNGGMLPGDRYFVVRITFFLTEGKHIDYYFNHNIY